MSISIGNVTIRRVRIYDDNARARESVAWSVTDADLEPLQESGPLPDLARFAKLTMDNADAAILDHRLRLIGKYAAFNGAEAVAYLYGMHFPALLCTAYGKADIDEMRRYRRCIPALLPTNRLDPYSIVKGLERCVKELSGDFVPSRKPWRTLVRIDDVNLAPGYKMFYVVLPGWPSSEKVRLPIDLIPEAWRPRIQPGTRFYAEVNIGTENQDDLYFEHFQFS